MTERLNDQEAVAWTGSGSLAALKAGLEGCIWPSRAEAHPIALYAHPTPVGDRWNDALEAIAQGMAVSRDQDEAEAYSHCGTSDWDGSPSDYIADCRAEIRTILDAALTPTSLRSVEEPLAAREERVMQQWKFGNLTPLGVANALMKEGFNSTYAAGKANYLRSLNPHPQSVGSEASTRIAELEAAWQPTHRHVKRGTDYQVIGTAHAQIDRPIDDNEPMTVYRGQDGFLWVRPTNEFHDGRFRSLSGEG